MKRLMLFAALIVWSGIASAVVYKWIDAQGKVMYGDRPPDGVHAEVVELLGTHTASNNSARPAPASSAKAAAAAKDDAQHAVDEDVAATRDKQCAAAQERYKKLIEGRKLYKAGADGQHEFLTAEQIDTERVNAKRDVDTICNSTT